MTMTTRTREQIVADKFEILENSITSLCHRDNGDWAGLGRCFHADSRITTSWFDGTAAEFVAQSNAMMSGHHPKDTQRHMMSNPRITLAEADAVVLAAGVANAELSAPWRHGPA